MSVSNLPTQNSFSAHCESSLKILFMITLLTLLMLLLLDAGVKTSKGGKSSKMERNIAGQTDRDRESLPEGNQPNDDAGDVDDYGATENILQPGTKISINDFQLLTVVGRGSFGKVYLVKKKDNGHPYAMKILKKDQLIKKNLLIKTQGKTNDKPK